MLTNKAAPIIYNLFPRLCGNMLEWIDQARRARNLGFNMLFINSIHYPGFSGSLYAVKHHYAINPDFLPQGLSGSDNGMELLKETLSGFRDLGLTPIMDLIINHTSRDCPLVQEHPQWYLHNKTGNIVSPYAVDPDDASKVTVWGDLAEIDNASSTDQSSLWEYWANLVETYLGLGFGGFRCDAAYKVPAELWQFLIKRAKSIKPEALFLAENLGSKEKETLALRNTGFDYFFNSSKWWNFEQKWCLKQHRIFGRIAPSISFPETHDTKRLAADSGGNESIQRQRYAFAATFSAGLMMPIGYEFGFKTKLDVVKTRPSDWESPAFDLSHFVKRVNLLKTQTALLQGEGKLKKIANESDVLILRRRTDAAPGKTAIILINKNITEPAMLKIQNFVGDASAAYRLYPVCRDDAPIGGMPCPPQEIELQAAEVALLLQ